MSKVKFKGYTLNCQVFDNTAVLVVAGTALKPESFLGEKIDVGSHAFIAYEACDPYMPPFVDYGHPNAGKFLEVKIVREGEDHPKPRVTNVDEREWSKIKRRAR